MRQEVYLKNQSSEFNSFLNKFNIEKIFLIVDKDSYVASGAKEFVDKTFDNKLSVGFSDFNTNPQLKDLNKGISLFNKKDYELIIALGGGSVIDMAKLISVMSHQNNEIVNITKGLETLNNIKTKLLAIPTTAGTGAEATSFSVLYIDKVKYSIASNTILPDYVYLFPKFLKSASPYLTACTGLDAFSQAVESVWSINSNKKSEEYAYEAIDIIWKNLLLAVNNNDERARTKMQYAAYLAGKSINITKTTAPHALSYAFTSYYNIPHGHAVALSLPFFFDYNFNVTIDDCNDIRGYNTVKLRINKIFEIIGVSKENAVDELEKYFNNIGIEINIHYLIRDFKPEIIIKNINIERLKNNPRKLKEDVLLVFLNSKTKKN